MVEQSPARDPLAVAIEESFREGRRTGLSIAATADVVAEVIRSKVGEDAETEGLAKADHVHMQSIVGARSGEPFVQCRVGFEQWQWDVPTTRGHALALLECAEAAIHDAAVLRWLTLGNIGLDRTAAFAAIVDLRRFRGDVDREDWRVPDE